MPNSYAIRFDQNEDTGNYYANLEYTEKMKQKIDNQKGQAEKFFNYKYCYAHHEAINIF